MARAAARRAAARTVARAAAARAAAGRPAASRLVAQTTARGRRLEPRWATARQADARRATARAAARATTGRRCDRRRFDAVEPVARHEALLSVRAWVGGDPDCTGSGARTCDQSPKGLESLAAFGGSSRSAGDRQVTGRRLAGEAAGEITASIAVACTHISIEKDGVHAFVQVQRRQATRSTPGIF